MSSYEHWSASIEAAELLEQSYAEAVGRYKHSGSVADKRVADAIGPDVRAARQFWREAGNYAHAIDPAAAGARNPNSIVKITENN